MGAKLQGPAGKAAVTKVMGSRDANALKNVNPAVGMAPKKGKKSRGSKSGYGY